MAERDVEARVTVKDDSAAGVNSVIRNMRRAAAEAKVAEAKARESAGLYRKIGFEAGNSITNGLGNAAKAIGNTLASVGIKSGAKLGESVASGLSNATPQIQTALGAAAVSAVATLAPLISAGISGAVVGGAAGGGVLGGLLLASQDARVAAAGTALGQRVFSGLKTEAGVFVKPALDAIGQVDVAWTRARGQIGAGLAAAARYVAPLTDALLDAGDAVLNGLVAAIRNAGPAVSALSYGIRALGKATGDALTTFAGLGDAGAVALRDLLGLTSLVIRAITSVLAQLTWWYGQIRTLGGLIGDVKDETTDLGAASDAAAGGGLLNFVQKLDETEVAAGGASAAVTGLNTATRDLAGANVALTQAQVATEQAFARANEVREQGTVATANEREALAGLIGVINAETTAMAAQGATSDQVNAKSNELRESFIKQAQAMGYSKAGAEALAASYGLFPKVVATDVKLNGANTAKAELERIQAAAGSIPAAINIAVRVTGSSNVAEVARSLAKQSMAADNGAVFGQHAERMSSAIGMASGGSRLAGATMRDTRPVRVESSVQVLLDGRAIAPQARAIAKQLDDRQRWNDRRVPR